ncbi:hypothetical protein BS17DRAFT_785961 [Gyrodon lividus]|nr:hypothetical protein BS17DRAFT_785961 [Gyrodon lividus]
MGVYTQVIFAGILKRIFFKVVPSLLSPIGTVIIITSASSRNEHGWKPEFVKLEGMGTTPSPLSLPRGTLDQAEAP